MAGQRGNAWMKIMGIGDQKRGKETKKKGKKGDDDGTIG